MADIQDESESAITDEAGVTITDEELSSYSGSYGGGVTPAGGYSRDLDMGRTLSGNI